MWQQIAGKGVQGLGSILQVIQAAEAQKAMREALTKQLRLQSRYRNEATFGTLMPYAEGWSAEDATDTMQGDVSNTMQGYSGAYSMPSSMGEFSTLDKGFLQGRGQARANMNSYGNWLTGKDLDTMRVQQAIQRILSRAGGAAGVFPYQMQMASQKNAWLAALGEMLKQGGSSLESSGGGGMGSFGGK